MIGYLVVAVRCLLCCVLLVSTSTKLRDFPAFLTWLRRLRMVPERRIRQVGVLMTAIEAVTCVLVLLDLAGLVLAAVTMAFFAGATGYLVRRGITVPCRCFGAATAPMGMVEVARNSLLALVATAAAVVSPQPVPPVPAIILAVLLGGGVGLVVTRLEDVRTLFVP
jgi:uncharacterized membrane protein YphA (DoxX/SURF4 family)